MMTNRMLWLLAASLFILMFISGFIAGFFPRSQLSHVARYSGYSGLFISLMLWFSAWKLRSVADAFGGFTLPLYYGVMILWFPIGGFFVWWFLGNKGRGNNEQGKPQPVIQADR